MLITLGLDLTGCRSAGLCLSMSANGRLLPSVPHEPCPLYGDFSFVCRELDRQLLYQDRAKDLGCEALNRRVSLSKAEVWYASFLICDA